VNDETIDRLRSESSRGDYGSMARLARALYEAGLEPREVLRRCYGVEFPDEFFSIAEAGRRALGLLLVYTNQPWELAVPPDRGGLRPAPHLLDTVERKVFARDPDLVPLGLILDSQSRWAGTVLCYRLTELAAGRPAVFGIREEVTPDDEVVRCGESLLEVLHEHHADVLRGLEAEWRHPSNFGAGSVDLEDLAEVRTLIERIEELQRTVASR
jgi:hypothetical protein